MGLGANYSQIPIIADIIYSNLHRIHSSVWLSVEI